MAAFAELATAIGPGGLVRADTHGLSTLNKVSGDMKN